MGQRGREAADEEGLGRGRREGEEMCHATTGRMGTWAWMDLRYRSVHACACVRACVLSLYIYLFHL